MCHNGYFKEQVPRKRTLKHSTTRNSTELIAMKTKKRWNSKTATLELFRGLGFLILEQEGQTVRHEDNTIDGSVAARILEGQRLAFIEHLLLMINPALPERS